MMQRILFVFYGRYAIIEIPGYFMVFALQALHDTMDIQRTVNGTWPCGEDAGFWSVQLNSEGL